MIVILPAPFGPATTRRQTRDITSFVIRDRRRPRERTRVRSERHHRELPRPRRRHETSRGLRFGHLDERTCNGARPPRADPGPAGPARAVPGCPQLHPLNQESLQVGRVHASPKCAVVPRARINGAVGARNERHRLAIASIGRPGGLAARGRTPGTRAGLDHVGGVRVKVTRHGEPRPRCALAAVA